MATIKKVKKIMKKIWDIISKWKIKIYVLEIDNNETYIWTYLSFLFLAQIAIASIFDKKV